MTEVRELEDDEIVSMVGEDGDAALTPLEDLDDADDEQSYAVPAEQRLDDDDIDDDDYADMSMQHEESPDELLSRVSERDTGEFVDLSAYEELDEDALQASAENA